MKNEILIGRDEAHKELNIDVDALLTSRLLIQANSGGGKSWLLRRLAEQLYGKVPVIIIDPEGEFATLREKFGYVLVGKGGETPADLRSAAVVAHKLLELGASAVCDLYELKPYARHQWVKIFLEALIDSPKELWKPVVVIVDEAHQFCPEGKTGESEASGAMVDLASRGRKRGFCAVFATQRLGKLRKDAAAELFNVLIGMTFVDIDRDRAAECLGISKDEKKTFNDEVKMIPAGTFYGLGRAICKERRKVKIGDVQTTHPEAGGKKFAAPAPPAPEAIAKLLPKLADLPKQAEEKAKTEGELRKEITKLKTELTLAKKEQPKAVVSEPEKVPALTDHERTRLTKLIEVFESLTERSNSMAEKIKDVSDQIGCQRAEVQFFKLLLENKLSTAPPQRAIPARNTPSFGARRTETVIRRPVPTPSGNGEADTSIGGGMRRMMIALAQRPGLNKRQIGVRAGLSSTSGTFGTYMGALRSRGYLTENGSGFELTQEGIDALGSYEPLPEGQKLYEYWLRDLGDSGAARILKTLFEAYPESLTKEELGERAQISHTSGTFGTYLGKLRTLELIEGRGELKATEEFFE